MGTHEQIIRRFRSELLLKLTLWYGLILVSGWAFIWGTVVLVSRAAIGTKPEPLLWGALGVVPAIALAYELARRRLPEIAAVRAMIDRHSTAGGLVMAEDESDIGAWRGRVPRLVVPAARFRNNRHWLVLLASLTFVAVGFAVPERYVNITSQATLDVTEQTEELETQIDALEEEKIIDTERAEQLKEKLEQITADARAEDPSKTWEALDHLKDTLAKTAEEAAEMAMAEMQKVKEAQALAEGIREDQLKNAPDMGANLSNEAMAHLQDLLEQMQKNSKMFRDAMANKEVDASKIAPNSEKQMKQLFLRDTLDPQVMKEIEEKMREMGVNPKHAGQLKPEELAELQEALKDNRLTADERDALRDKLAKHELAKSELPEMSDEQLEELKKALEEMGLTEKDFAMIPKDMAKNLTSEQQKQLKELAKNAEPGKRFRQIYLDEKLPLKTEAKARMTLLKLELDEHLRDLDQAKRLAAEAAWKIAEAELMKKIDEQVERGVSEDQLKKELQRMAMQMPSAGLTNKHVGQTSEWTIDALRRAINDEFLDEWEFKKLEKEMARHQVPETELPGYLTQDQLDEIDGALQSMGLFEEQYALMPPPDRLSPEQMQQMQKLAGACKQCEGSLKSRLAKLSKMKMIDPKKLGNGNMPGDGSGKGLSKFLSENAGSMSMQGMMHSWSRSGPGKGGVNRGRGDAPLTWKDPTNEQGAGFDEQVLPPGGRSAQSSQLLGVSSSAPELSDAGPDATNALRGSEAGGGSATKQAVLPRHRPAVERYFKRE